MEAEVLLILAAGVNRAVEAFKKLLPASWSVDARRLLTLVFQIGAGIVAVVLAGDNLLSEANLPLHPVAAKVLLGATVGLGAEFIYVLVDIVKRLRGEDGQAVG
jgi:hypothetical protein